MARRRKKKRGGDGGRDPKMMGALWRQLMREDLENIFSLVWRRVHRLHGIDLKDVRQSSDIQIYDLLSELIEVLSPDGESDQFDIVNVEKIDLETLIDSRVPIVFRL